VEKQTQLLTFAQTLIITDLHFCLNQNVSFCPYYFLLFFIIIIIYLFFLAHYSLYDTKKILEEFAVFELFKTF